MILFNAACNGTIFTTGDMFFNSANVLRAGGLKGFTLLFLPSLQPFMLVGYDLLILAYLGGRIDRIPDCRGSRPRKKRASDGPD